MYQSNPHHRSVINRLKLGRTVRHPRQSRSTLHLHLPRRQPRRQHRQTLRIRLHHNNLLNPLTRLHASKKESRRHRQHRPSRRQSLPPPQILPFILVPPSPGVFLTQDEAHVIKDTSTNQSIAACALNAQRRLCLTGTPLQNRLDDYAALVKFLRLVPFDNKHVWAHWIGGPLESRKFDGVWHVCKFLLQRRLCDEVKLKKLMGN